jgi:HEAT repeat protein
MYNTRFFTVCAVFFATSVAAIAAEAKKPLNEKQLIAVLQTDSPGAEKAVACKRLAICGGKNAVPALAPLLADEYLASWARIALEAIPDPAADAALRQALGKVQGRLLVGVINSIGARRDAKSADALIERLKDADAEVASAAAVALGRIGGPAVTKALEQSLAAAPAKTRSAVAEGCILCAERCQADGNSEEAVRLFDAVRKADVSKQRVVEATRGAILARQSAGVPLLVEQLRSSDKALFAIGLSVAREVPGSEVTAAIAAELGRAAPGKQALLVLALADRGDAAALPAVLQAAKSGSEEVRTAATRVLGRLGNASCIPMLLDAAMDANAQISQPALAVLTEMRGKDVDADIVERLAKTQGKARQVLIQLAGRRNIGAAVPLLLKAADDPDAQVRAAALLALGSTVAAGDLPVLIARVAGAKDAEEGGAACKALGLACQRMPDREACAEKLLSAMSRAPVAVKCRFLEVLAAVGGAKALKAMSDAARDADPEVRDVATRLLGEWMGVDAAPVLLDLAKNGPEAKFKTRALRGYIRLVRQFAMSDEDRVKMCRIAMETAEQPAEKKLVLELLDRYPSLDTLKLAVEAAKTPSLKDAATAVAIMIAQKAPGDPAEIRKLLADVRYEPVKVEILKAEYGAGAQSKDVTETLRRHARDFPMIVLPTSQYNSAFGGDPAPSVPKELKIQYRLNGKAGTVTFPENATILLPAPK